MKRSILICTVIRAAFVAMIGLTGTLPAFAGSIQIGTWNLEGPAGLDGRGELLEEFGRFFGSADVVVIEETIGDDQITAFLKTAKLKTWSHAISDFAKDTYDNPYKKLELAIITPHPIGLVKEIDPYKNDDTEEMRARDENFDVPTWMPADQRNKKGTRGWFWVEIPDLKLVVIAVHLKSSRGKSGIADQENSFKREAVTSALAVAIADDARSRSDWSYMVAGDFNVAPGDAAKVGTDLTLRCQDQSCVGYDQTHALLGGGLVTGLVMRNLTVGLGASYAKGAFVDSPIDNIYTLGSIFDRTKRMIVERGPTFGSDHFSIRVTLD